MHEMYDSPSGLPPKPEVKIKLENCPEGKRELETRNKRKIELAIRLASGRPAPSPYVCIDVSPLIATNM
jgi:hypothetical protein